MEWIGGAALVLLWMIMSRVQDSLTCLKQANDRLEAIETEMRTMRQEIVQQSELVEIAVNNIGTVANDYDRHFLRPLNRSDF